MSHRQTRKSPETPRLKYPSITTQDVFWILGTFTPAMRTKLSEFRKLLAANPTKSFQIGNGNKGKIICSAQDFIEDIDDLLGRPQSFWK